ncbi:MAG: shikimate kinase [Faecalibacillus sp.]
MKNIVLIGIMGCGKTTVSKLLSEKLKMPVIDMDEYLIEKHQCSINDMFAVSEDYFRDLESQACIDLAQLEGYIISTGGGVIKRKKNSDILKQTGTIIYLDRPVDNIVHDVATADRPLLKEGPQKLYQLFDERHQLYLDACDYHVHNDGTLADVVNKIIEITKTV